MLGSIRYGQYRSDVLEEDLAYVREHHAFIEEHGRDHAATKLQGHWRGHMMREQTAQKIEDEGRHDGSPRRERGLLRATKTRCRHVIP